MANVKDTVIILGSYEHPHEEELIQVRDFVTSRGYDSFLIKNLPHIPEQSLEEKIRLWTMASRFCVMVDREASGHIKEYEMLKEERKPLILARPRGTGSSWTFGDDEIVDLNYIRTFEFEDSPLEILEDGMRWVEDIIEERKQAYSNHYPWRGS